MRSPVTDLVQRYNTLTQEQQKVFLDLVDPQPEPEQTVKQKRKRATTNAKSKHAASLAEKVQGTAAKVESSTDRCTYKYPEDSPVNSGMVCDEPGTNGVHDATMGYVGFHEFEAPKVKKAAK